MSSGMIRRRKNVRNTASNSISSATNLTQSHRSHPSTTDATVTVEGSPTQSGHKSLRLGKKEYDEYAWFAVFLFAASYFILTRRGGGIHHSRGGLLSSFSKPYPISASSVSVVGDHEEIIRSIFYIAKYQKDVTLSSLELAPNHQLELVLSSPPDIYCATETTNKCNSNYNQEQCDKESDNVQQTMPFLSHLTSTTWVHDEDLGRGYLLLADCGRSGRIWRWEVGGGPITIGRSLHMERSGCRSGLWVNGEKEKMNLNNDTSCPENTFSGSVSSCSEVAYTQNSTSPPLLGSASLAVELTRDAERSSVGKNIIVAEWGERRIVRVEGETGARTPLVVLVPPQKQYGQYEVEGGELEEMEASNKVGQEKLQEWERIQHPNHLTFTPFGDLLFSDNRNNIGLVYRLKEAVHVEPIPTEESRDAHGWERSSKEDQTEQSNIDILFQSDGAIEGLALSSDYSLLYVLAASPVGKIVYQISLDSDDNEVDSGDVNNDKPGDVEKSKISVFYSMTFEDCDDSVQSGHTPGSKLSVDEDGILYMISCPSTVTLLSRESKEQGITIGKLSSQGSEPFTSIDFGEDGYLYITSQTELRRLKSRKGGMLIPTNLVVPRLSTRT